MVITLGPDLEAALGKQASRQGVSPEVLALDVLRAKLLPTMAEIQSQDEWEKQLRGLARDCGVSLPDSALSSEGLYEQ